MNKTINFAIFVMGAVVGSMVTWRYVKSKYEQITQEEIDSVKEVYSKKKEVIFENDSEDETISVEEYETKLKTQGYMNYSDIKREAVNVDGPYTISPDEFGENDNYEEVSLTYYADKVLADENDEIVNDVDYLIGYESLYSFGEYDVIFVRNDEIMCDYEISLDERDYLDIFHSDNRRPHEVDD